jgi:hypothetical protein
MASNTRNVKLGVCSVTFNGEDLGYTKGGVEVTIASTTKEVMVDQFGNSPINEYILGRTCTAKVPLAETTLLNLARIMPGSTVNGTGGAASAGSLSIVTAPPAEGDSFTIGTQKFTFSAVPVLTTDVLIGGTPTLCAASLAAAINLSIDTVVDGLWAEAAIGVVTLTAKEVGVDNNSIALVKSFATPAHAAVSGATLTGGVDLAIASVTVTNGVGISLLTLARSLVFHPQALPPEDRSEDFLMPLAATPGAATFSYKLDNERVFNVDFKAYPDSVTRKLFVYGDARSA